MTDRDLDLQNIVLEMVKMNYSMLNMCQRSSCSGVIVQTLVHTVGQMLYLDH